MQGPSANKGWVAYGNPGDHTYAWYEKHTFQGIGVTSFYYYPLHQEHYDHGVSKDGTKAPIPFQCTAVDGEGSSQSFLPSQTRETILQSTEFSKKEEPRLSTQSSKMEKTSTQSSMMEETRLQYTESSTLEETSPVHEVRTSCSTSQEDPEVTDCYDIVPMDISPVASPVHHVASDSEVFRTSGYCGLSLEADMSGNVRNAKNILEKSTFVCTDSAMPSTALNTKNLVQVVENSENMSSEHKGKLDSGSQGGPDVCKLKLGSLSRSGSSSEDKKIAGGLPFVRNTYGKGLRTYSKLPSDWLTPQPVKKHASMPQTVLEPNISGGRRLPKLLNERMIAPLTNVKSERGFVNTTGTTPLGLRAEPAHRRATKNVLSEATPQPVKKESGNILSGKFNHLEVCNPLTLLESEAIDEKVTAKLASEKVIVQRDKGECEKGYVNTIGTSATELQAELAHQRAAEKVVSRLTQPVKRRIGKFSMNKASVPLTVLDPEVLDYFPELVNEGMTFCDRTCEKGCVNTGTSRGLHADLAHRRATDNVKLTPQPVRRGSGKVLNGKFTNNPAVRKSLIVQEPKVVDGKATASLLTEGVITGQGDGVGKKGVHMSGTSTKLQAVLVHKKATKRGVASGLTPEMKKKSGKVLNGKFDNPETRKSLALPESNEEHAVNNIKRSRKDLQTKLAQKKTNDEVSGGFIQLASTSSVGMNSAPQGHSKNAFHVIGKGGGTKPINETAGKSINIEATYVVPNDISSMLLPFSDFAFSKSLGGCIQEKLDFTVQLEKLHDGIVWVD